MGMGIYRIGVISDTHGPVSYTHLEPDRDKHGSGYGGWIYGLGGFTDAGQRIDQGGIPWKRNMLWWDLFILASRTLRCV